MNTHMKPSKNVFLLLVNKVQPVTEATHMKGAHNCYIPLWGVFTSHIGVPPQKSHIINE